MNHVGMDRSQTTIQGGKAPAVSPRQGGEVGIADLAVADDSTEINSVITEIVGPEPMSFVDDHVAEESPRFFTRCSFSHQEPHQRALGDGARGERAGSVYRPPLGQLVMNVVVDDEGDEQVGVEQVDVGVVTRHLRGRTSSCVTMRPTRAMGSPVLGLRWYSKLPDRPKPLRTSSATVSLHPPSSPHITCVNVIRSTMSV